MRDVKQRWQICYWKACLLPSRFCSFPFLFPLVCLFLLWLVSPVHYSVTSICLLYLSDCFPIVCCHSCTLSLCQVYQPVPWFPGGLFRLWLTGSFKSPHQTCVSCILDYDWSSCDVTKICWWNQVFNWDLRWAQTSLPPQEMNVKTNCTYVLLHCKYQTLQSRKGKQSSQVYLYSPISKIYLK